MNTSSSVMAKKEDSLKNFFSIVETTAQLYRYHGSLSTDHGYLEIGSVGESPGFYWEVDFPKQTSLSKELKAVYMEVEPRLLNIHGRMLKKPTLQEALDHVEKAEKDRFERGKVSICNIKNGRYIEQEHRLLGARLKINETIEMFFSNRVITLSHYNISEPSPKMHGWYSMDRKEFFEELRDDIKFTKNIYKNLTAISI